jgi:hypothetical protein
VSIHSFESYQVTFNSDLKLEDRTMSPPLIY